MLKLVGRARRTSMSELRKMPRDGAKNFDHYLDGSPKQK